MKKVIKNEVVEKTIVVKENKEVISFEFSKEEALLVRDMIGGNATKTLAENLVARGSNYSKLNVYSAERAIEQLYRNLEKVLFFE